MYKFSDSHYWKPFILKTVAHTKNMLISSNHNENFNAIKHNDFSTKFASVLSCFFASVAL